MTNEPRERRSVLIEDGEPDCWQDLEDRVTAIMNEAGFQAKRNDPIQTARGQVNVDVAAFDKTTTPELLTLFECKHWKASVPKTIVHSFRTVVADSGAHLGLIVSRSGFQSGAEEAAAFSNVKLVNWVEFQGIYAERWYLTYMMDFGWEQIERLLEYVEPIMGRDLARRLDAVSGAKRKKFVDLHNKNIGAQDLMPLFFKPMLQMFRIKDGLPPPLPIFEYSPQFGNPGLPPSVTHARSLRGLLEAVTTYAKETLAEFDETLTPDQ